MPTETERKFLVRKDLWYALHKPAGEYYLQGYIVSGPDKTVRVRLTETKGFITLKGPSVNISRSEYEYEIPRQDALEMLEEFAGKKVEKMRYRVVHQDHAWEVDEFLGENEGLILAEIELSCDGEAFERPGWLGEEVSHDPRYYNAYLAEHPFGSWK